jgi:hypothetical protein
MRDYARLGQISFLSKHTTILGRAEARPSERGIQQTGYVTRNSLRLFLLDRVDDVGPGLLIVLEFQEAALLRF